MSAPDSGNSAPSAASASASTSCGRSRSTTTSPEGPQAIPTLYGARVHQSRIWSGEVVARSCQFPRSAGRFPPAAQGNTCQPCMAAVSADRTRAGSARGVTSATLTPLLFPRKHDRQPRARLQIAESSGSAIFVPVCRALVGDAGKLHAGQLQLVGPLAGPAEGAGGLTVHVGARGAAGEVNVLAPVHSPRVRSAGVGRKVLRQLPEEPGHDRGLTAVPPQRVEPVAEPAGAPPREIVPVAAEPAVDVLGVAVHAQPHVEVIDVELSPFAVAPDLVGGGAVAAVVGALDGMPDLVRGQLVGEGVSLPPGVQAAVADVVVIVDGTDVIAGVAAAVPPGVVDGVDARVGSERVAVGRLGVLPGLTDEADRKSTRLNSSHPS